MKNIFFFIFLIFQDSLDNETAWARFCNCWLCKQEKQAYENLNSKLWKISHYLNQDDDNLTLNVWTTNGKSIVGVGSILTHTHLQVIALN